MSERDERSKVSMKSLLQREKSKSDFRIIRTVYKGKQCNGNKHIEIKLDNDHWITITDPVKIEEFLIDRNITNFGQADDTAFANGELLIIFDHHGTNMNAENLITNGSKPRTLEAN
jgi:hypothetical protein